MEAFEVDELPFDVEEELASEPEVVAVPGAAAAVQLQVAYVFPLAPSFPLNLS